MRYRVITTVQSVIGTSDPVEVTYYTGSDLAQALVALGQAALLIDSEWTNTLSVRIDFTPDSEPEVEVSEPSDTEPVASLDTWDFETDASLDDCIYWSGAETDCTGPRVGVRLSDGVVVCERHVNHPPKDV